MHKLISWLVFLLISTIITNGCTSQSRYIFYLHHKFLEEFSLDDVHPEYGKAEYHAILDTFRKAGFTVVSEKRPAKTDMHVYARRVVTQIDSLLLLGANPNHITVIGTSKGGYIAQYVSTYLANPDVNYVFIGAFQDQDIEAYPDIQFCGHILTIYASDDFYGVSAIRRMETSKLKVSSFKEIELNTGIGHGFLYKPMREWVEPSIMWANRKG
jgi:hypothetical protein